MTHSFAEHTGELEIHLEAGSLVELFVEAARALAEVMAGSVAIAGGEARTVSIAAPDREALLVEWLNELVFLAERDKRIYGDARIERLTDRALVASVGGAEVSELRTQVKAATFHRLRILDRPDGAVAATVILDV